MAKLLASMGFAIFAIGCATEKPPYPPPFIDPENFVVGVGEWSIDLVRECGISADLKNPTFDAVSYYRGWFIVFLINSIPVVEIKADSGDFKCRESAAAFRPAA